MKKIIKKLFKKNKKIDYKKQKELEEIHLHNQQALKKERTLEERLRENSQKFKREY
ncbi:MAG: hypothetical protein ACNI25_06645 [Halarcobacter sp.]